MIPAVTIDLTRREGPADQLGAVTLTGPDVWEQARDVLAAWSHTAPDGLDSDRTDYTVTYADGFTYTGRFPLSAYTSDLSAHLHGFTRFAVRHCGHRDRYRHFAATYDLGPAA